MFKLVWAMLVGLTTACWQVEVQQIANNGTITDYQSDEDEIFMWFGVGSFVFYEYQNNFVAG